jgi:hypothetical protein
MFNSTWRRLRRTRGDFWGQRSGWRQGARVVTLCAAQADDWTAKVCLDNDLRSF